MATLPADVVVVIAGREVPPVPWRTDPGWRSVLTTFRLAALDGEQSRRLLVEAGVDQVDHERLVQLGRGHPLTLAMLASATAAGTRIEEFAEAPTW